MNGKYIIVYSEYTFGILLVSNILKKNQNKEQSDYNL